MEIAELGKTPVAGETPQGKDPKYEPAYGVLQDEIRKLSSLSAGSMDWSVVVNAATEVLSTVAKDIPAAVYLAVGLGQTQGLVGWIRGTQVLTDILTEYWDTAFPPLARLRARVNSLDWWKERSLALLESWSGNPPCSWEDAALALETLQALDTRLAECLPDQPPLYDVREALRRVPAQSPPQENTAAVSPDAPPAAPGSSVQAVPVSSPQPVAEPAIRQVHDVKTLPDAYGMLHQLAGETLNFVCGAEPSSEPLAWKIVYASLFGKIAVLPSADGGTTAIPAPDATMLAVCRSHMEAGRHLAGVGAAMAFAPACPLWLDVQRCVAEGLLAAGPDYAGALSVVRHECASLLERLPDLAALSFADGTPFADPATQNWLAALSSGDGNASRSVEETLAAEAVTRAGALLGQGNPVGALEVLEEAAKAVRAKDGTVWLRLRVQQVRVLCREARFALACTLADDLGVTVERHGLEQWNPALALDVRLAAHAAFAALEGGDGPRTREALRHVVCLSPAAALRLDN